MSNDRVDHHAFRVALIFLLHLTIGTIVVGDSLDFDKEVLLSLKIYLEDQNHVNRGRYFDWNQPSRPPCAWPGISCFVDRVNGIDLSGSKISGGMFGNFSVFIALTHLNLSGNTISSEIPADLGQCQSLKFLDLSHNLIADELNLTGLNKLEVLDVSLNRISGGIQLTFPETCDSLVLANLSTNSFIGSVFDHFNSCWNLRFLDLSANNFSGKVWPGFANFLFPKTS